MAITPRFIPGISTHTTTETVVDKVERFSVNGWATNTKQVPDASEISPFYKIENARRSLENSDRKAQSNENTTDLTINLESGFELQQIKSSYHAVVINNNHTTIIANCYSTIILGH